MAAKTYIDELGRGFMVALEASSSAMLFVDSDGVIRAANELAERTFRAIDEPLVGVALERLIPPESRDAHAEMVRDFLCVPEPREMGRGRYLEAARLDGTRLPVEVGLSPVELEDEVWVLCSIVDITLRRGLEQQLVNSALDARRLEGVTRLARGVGHDLNNMLACVTSNVEYALDFELPEEVRGCLEDVIEASKHSAKLANELLTFAGVSKKEFEAVGLNAIVRALVPVLRAITGSMIQLEFELSDHDPDVQVNALQIQQVMCNLIDNARAAIDGEGVVTIETRVESLSVDRWVVRPPGASAPRKFVVIEVTDTGHGMSDETISRMCEPYFSTRGEGRGMGMAAVCGILESHGAGLFVESVPGQGSVIKLYFPTS